MGLGLGLDNILLTGQLEFKTFRFKIILLTKIYII